MISWLCCSWACDEEAHHGRSMWWSKTAHLMAREQKREEEEGDGVLLSASRATSPTHTPEDLPLGPTS